MQGSLSRAHIALRIRATSRIRAFGQISATLALALVAACSSDSNPINQVTPAITVAVGTPTTVASPGVPAVVPIVIQRVGSFAGDVTLAAEGLPTGATAVFAPATIAAGSTTSVMTISLGATAVQSSGTVTVRASGAGGTAATAAVAFTANVPSNPTINLTAGASTVSIPQGQTGTVALTLERLGGFAGAVAIAAEGLPTGVTINPVSFATGITNATLTLNVGTTAAAGVTNVTVRASGSGVSDKTVTVQLTITASATPDFTLTATPAALTVAPGAGGQSVINLARSGGFAGNVTFTTSALPAGISATFTPNPATANTSTLAFTTTTATVPGVYTITVTGAATGQTARTVNVVLTVSAAPSVAIALSSTSASVAAGASTPTTVTLTRNGGLTGDLTLTAENVPTGVSVAFAPPSPVAGTTTTATINTTAAAVPGVYTINLRATGTGGVTTTAAFTLTVTAAQGFSVAFTSSVASIAVGGTGTLTANITRTGGFTGAVNLSVSGLPATITATVNPVSATGASATVNISVAAGTAAGTYNGTLNGTATGLTATATPFTITVTGGGGGGGGANIQWVFCDPSRIPLFFAFRDGTAGAWTRVAPAGSTFAFTLSQSVGSVAFVEPDGAGGFATTVYLQTASEFQAIANSECASFPIPGTKTITATAAGLATTATQSQSATIALGNSQATASTFALTATLTKVLPGALDLVAVRSAQVLSPFSITPDAIIIRRALNLADGSAVTPVLNFGVGGDAVAPVTATVTVNNAGTDAVTIFNQFVSSNGTTATLGLPIGNANLIYGVPSGSLVAGDLHRLVINASDAQATNSRSSILYFKDVANKTVTLGPVLNAPTVTAAVGTVLRPRLQGTLQAQYQTGFGGGFSQTTRSITFSASRGYFSGTTYDFDTPDLAGVAGYNTTWGLIVGASTTYSLSGTNATSGAIVDGSSLLFASRTGPVTPVALRR